MSTPMNIKSYKTSRVRLPREQDSLLSADVDTFHGFVKLFVYYGGKHGDPFTTLEMSLGFRRYYARFDRAFHRRWIKRLCNEFADKVLDMNDKRN